MQQLQKLHKLIIIILRNVHIAIVALTSHFNKGLDAIHKIRH